MKVRQICTKTGNLRSVQLRLRHTRMDSTARSLGVELEATLATREAIAVQTTRPSSRTAHSGHSRHPQRRATRAHLSQLSAMRPMAAIAGDHRPSTSGMVLNGVCGCLGIGNFRVFRKRGFWKQSSGSDVLQKQPWGVVTPTASIGSKGQKSIENGHERLPRQPQFRNLLQGVRTNL